MIIFNYLKTNTMAAEIDINKLTEIPEEHRTDDIVFQRPPSMPALIGLLVLTYIIIKTLLS